MTAARLAAMKEGRERQLAIQRETDSLAVESYHGWLREEHAAHDKFTKLRDYLGADNELVSASREFWQMVLARMPATPSDSNPAWQR